MRKCKNLELLFLAPDTKELLIVNLCVCAGNRTVD